MLMRLTVPLLTSAFCLLHLFACDLPLGGGIEGEGDGGGEGEGEGEGEGGTCGGSCDAADFTACTCGTSDPCGWASDGFCDEPACAAVTANAFRDPDCAGEGEGEGEGEVPSCGPANCDGCCQGTTCIALPGDTNCGSGGGACTACADPSGCGVDESCASFCELDGTCVVPRFGTCLFGDNCAFGTACRTFGGEEVGFCSTTCTPNNVVAGASGFLAVERGNTDACTADEVCAVTGFCSFANLSFYTLAVSGIDLCATNPTGQDWDIGGGAPDPIIQIVVNGVEVARSAAVQDSFGSGVFFVDTLFLSTTDSLTVNVLDDDLTGTDFGGGFCFGGGCDLPVGIEFLRGTNADGTGDCSRPGVGVAAMSLGISPSAP